MKVKMADTANASLSKQEDSEEIVVEAETALEEEEEEEAQSQSQNGENKEKEKDRDKNRRRDRRRSRSPRRSRSRSRDRDRQRKRIVNVSSTRIIVKNMPYELKWQDIKDMFRKEVGDVAYVEMIEGNDGKQKGMAVVEFKDKDATRKAIETMHQYKVHDRYLVVNEEREKDRRMLQAMGHMPGGGGERGGGGGGGGGGGRGGGMGDMRDRGMGGGMGGLGPSSMGAVGLGMGGGMGGMGGLGPSSMGAMGGMLSTLGAGGLTPEILAQLGIEGPISNTVFVANLDYKVTWHKLKEVFKLAGNVVKADIKEDKSGKSRGMGTVTFEQPWEAVQAVSMFNNQSLFDRRMIVRMDKVPDDQPPPGPKLPSGLKSIGMGLGLGGCPLTNTQLSSVGTGVGMGAGLGASGLGAGGLGGGLGGAAGFGLGVEGLGGLSANSLSALSGLGLGAGLGGLGSMGLGAGLGGMGGGLGKLGIEGLGGMGLDSVLMGGGGGSGGGYGGSSDRGGRREERGQRFTRPDNCTVLVKNLPYAVTWQDLRERFREIGEVKFAEIKLEKGRSTGQGLVRFSTEDDALRAIDSMDQTRFEGRTIEVRMYRG